MRQEHPFGASDVRHVRVWGSQATVEHVGWRYVPQSLTAAQLNLPYCVATYLLDGDCFVDQFVEEKVADGARMALAERVGVEHDPAITERGAYYRHMVRVEVRLEDGTRLTRTVEAPRGSEQSFAPGSDVIDKFEKLASRALPARQVERIRDTVLDLESLVDASKLVGLMARSAEN
jgi:2-methylcitrate dehydratase PrpD